MSGIRTAIELQDNFTNVLYQVIDSVNLGLAAMEDLHQGMSAAVDTTSIDAARDSIYQAASALQQLGAAAPEPVDIPVHWQTDGMEVFTGAGTERFRQEVSSINAMLEELSSTQDAIAKQAYNMPIFPPDAFQDLNSMAVRVDTIRDKILQMENNPMNIGSDIANAELEQMRGTLYQLTQEQQNLNRAVENMDVQAANEAYLRLSRTVGSTEIYIRDNVDEQGRFNREIEEGANEANGLMQTIKGAVAAYVTIQSFSAVLNLSDQVAATTARLNLMNDGLQSTEELQNMIFLSAERSRGSYQATADAVSKFGILAGDAFGSSEEVVAFMEQVNKQFVIAGTEAAGIDAAMLQLTQAMGAGVLRGEEFNSIMEQAPNMIQAIADYMEVPKGQLKDMAAEGSITADIVKAAMFAAADETNAKFEQMPQTFSQIWTSFQNNALMAFQPVLQRMNEIANSEAFQNFVNGAINGLSVVAGIALEIFDLLVSVAGAVADNWSWLEPIILGVAAALAVYYGSLALGYGWQLLCAAATGIMTVAQQGFNAVMDANPILRVVMIMLVLIGVIYGICTAIAEATHIANSGFGVITGAIATAVAFILNILIGATNATIQAIWTIFVEPFIGIIEFVLNVANGGFDSFGDAVANLIGNIISWFLSLGKIVTKIIDAIFGTDWTSGLNTLQDHVLEWGKNENAITLDRTAPMIDTRFDYGEAWDAGADWGDGVAESISSLFGGDEQREDEYKYEYGEPVMEGIDEIGDNTGAIRDAMEITEEDLKYLRDIAEQEAVNRFTTAEIIIEQTNHNTVSGRMDLEGMVDGLTAAVNEAVDIIAEGVYA